VEHERKGDLMGEANTDWKSEGNRVRDSEAVQKRRSNLAGKETRQNRLKTWEE
jgi:hypothetical protein